MKRSTDITSRAVRLGLFLLLTVTSQLLWAQEEKTRSMRDSVQTESASGLYSPLEVAAEHLLTSPATDSNHLDTVPSFKLKETLRVPYSMNPSLLFRGDYSTGGALGRTAYGTLYGSGAQNSVPGIGRFNEVALLYRHTLSRNLQFQLGMDAMKINMSRITGQTFSASGALMYQAADHLAFKAFGSYAIGNGYGMNTHSYGASMTLDLSHRFGVEVGAQRYYNSMRKRWETVPMVIPYYNFDKFKLGLDVGGILYEILRSTVFREKGNGGGPTITPPRIQLPLR